MEIITKWNVAEAFFFFLLLFVTRHRVKTNREDGRPERASFGSFFEKAKHSAGEITSDWHCCATVLGKFWAGLPSDQLCSDMSAYKNAIQDSMIVCNDRVDMVLRTDGLRNEKNMSFTTSKAFLHHTKYNFSHLLANTSFKTLNSMHVPDIFPLFSQTYNVEDASKWPLTSLAICRSHGGWFRDTWHQRCICRKRRRHCDGRGQIHSVPFALLCKFGFGNLRIWNWKPQSVYDNVIELFFLRQRKGPRSQECNCSGVPWEGKALLDTGHLPTTRPPRSQESPLSWWVRFTLMSWMNSKECSVQK